ncbi:MAG: hypothetical protein JZD41_06665 [Thermoproteus sp.]|nr:hypothetical protein [Thermoproteus sp.]
MPTIICPVCGRLADRLIEGMCEDCYVKTHPVAEVRGFKVVKCKYCGSLFVRGRWIKPKRGEEKLLIRLLRDNLSIKGEIKEINIKLEKDKIYYTVKGVGTLHEEVKPREVVFEHVAPLTYDVCLDCRRNVLGVERGLVRIRGFPAPLGELHLKKLEAIFEHVMFEARGKNLGSIISIDREGDGFVVMTTNAKLARHIASKIHSAIPSDFLESYKVVKSRGDKRVYHYTATVYIITVSPGDVIRRRDSLFLVLDVGDKEVLAVKLDAGSKVRMPAYRFTEVRTDVVGRGILGEIGADGLFRDESGNALDKVQIEYKGPAYYININNQIFVIPLL